jgi:hypothetical protein
MKRRLFTIAAALSLVTGMAILAIWVRSYFASDTLTLQRGHQYLVLSNRGSLTAVVASRYTVPMGSQPPFPAEERWPSYSDTWEFTWEKSDPWIEPAAPRFPGVRVGTWWEPEGGDLGVEAVDSGHQLRVPDWLLALPLLIIGGIGLRGSLIRRRTKRTGDALCVHCGYDLRASSDRCPECGMPRMKR